MKTRMFAMAFERGRVSERSAQAWGLVSRMMVSRDGGGSRIVVLARSSEVAWQSIKASLTSQC